LHPPQQTHILPTIIAPLAIAEAAQPLQQRRANAHLSQNTSAYASARSRGGTPNARIHAKICSIWLAQRDVPTRITAAQNVASSGAKEGYAPCGWIGRRGVEGVCERGSLKEKNSSSKALSMSSLGVALWAGGARKLLRGVVQLRIFHLRSVWHALALGRLRVPAAIRLVVP
jgi:hypothetical protein